MVFVGEGIDIRLINTQFLVFPCRSLYNCILCRPFTITLDIVASSVHLKLKYHKLHGELVVLLADLEATRKIHNTLQQDQGENSAMEINMTSLEGKLQNLNIRTPNHA